MTDTAARGNVMFSAAETGYGAAVYELRDTFGSRLAVERLGPDLGVISSPALSVGDVARACQLTPLLFIRHLTVERARIPRDEARNVDAVAEVVRNLLAEHPIGTDLALQTWATGSPEIGYGSGALFSHLATDLSDLGYSVSRADQRHVLSCCLTPAGVSVGLNTADESLSGWPGGRVRLSRRDEQISRAEFKLEELLQTVSLDVPQRGRAVDLGASPGGWTRILRQRGLAVWAVDPSELDRRVASDPQVHHFRMTAGEFLRRDATKFDLAVNDMRMEPLLSSRVMLDVAQSLRPGALAVVTLKIGSHRPVETVRRCIALLGQAYELVYARQLHHNRQEVTIVGRLGTR